MGMLDDAIREHLDLKRRQGADPAEIAKLETDALGGGKASVDEPAPDGEGEGTADTPEIEADEELVVAEVDQPTEEVAIELDPHESQPTAQFTAEEVEAAMEKPEPAPVPEPEPAPMAEPEPEPEPEPELFDADVPAQQTEAPAEEPTETPATEAALDELEETPDFLEETPEHDRLWFERKPPRDFDF